MRENDLWRDMESVKKYDHLRRRRSGERERDGGY